MPNKTFLYGFTDDKFIKPKRGAMCEERKLDHYKYSTAPILRVRHYDRNDLSIAFKASPESLLNLSLYVVDAIPLPSVYEWTIEDICRWLRGYGFPQYQNTFRQNLVNGHKLLLIDANALAAMNIKDFDHIRLLTNGIRSLYYYEMVKFGRSITLAPEYHYELYKRFRSQTGSVYESTRRSDLYRKMQLIREKSKIGDHWDLVEHTMNLEQDTNHRELFGRYPYRVNKTPPKVLRSKAKCRCIPPCECNWSFREMRPNAQISCTEVSSISVSPSQTVIGVLKKTFPFKYNIKKIYYSPRE